MGDRAREPGSWLAEGARRWPDREALCAGTQRWSYAQLAAAVDAEAERLRAAGLGAGDRLGIAASRHPQTLIHILAAVQAGVGYVPFDLGYPDERLAMMAEDSAPRAVVGEPAALAELHARLGALPTLEAPAPATACFGAEADLCYVLFTSGSTGRPKGVAMGREPLARLIDWHAAHPRLGLPARTLLFAPLSFDVHFQEIFSTLACGGCLVLTDESARRDPAQLVAVLRAQRIERLFLPYVALQMIADALEGNALPPLRDLVSAGEQLQVTAAIRALFARLPDAVLHNHYGPTESHVVTAFELAGDPAGWPAIPPIGAPLRYVQAILRPLEDTSENEGELLLGGPTLAHGYLGRPELSAERFLDTDTGRVYVTGDRVVREPDGVLRYLGRCDRQLKIDGFRIEPGEVEVALLAVPGVRDAAVGAAELPGVGRQLVAWLVAADDARQTETKVREALRDSLPTYLQPTRYVWLERLPLTPSGKIDRAALRVPEEVADRLPQGTPAEQIAALWRALLGRPDLGERDNLFDAGARSLLVLRFVAQLKAAGIAGISVADVYDAPSIAGLAERLQARPQALATRHSPRRAGGPIAIVGIALRCAGASDVEAFWDNLLEGVEGIRHFRPNEVDASVPDSLRRHPAFVAARGVIDDPDRFDAAFFGVPAREAVLIDPQQRLLLELAWNALEDAGLRPDGDERIGVYAGSANNTYITALRREAPQLIGPGGEFAAMLASEKDYVATRIAHKLDLKGPALSIHTACSTGLVAIAQACEALRAGQCEVALAGGATVVVPQAGGYVHVEGGMESADGHCRPFDAEATGTVFASGAAMVALKPLDAALADGDPVYAVIHGVGLNNDGAQKASFTAPNVAGQAAAIRQALDDAGLPARAIGYVEAHGTATTLGDPIEVAALTRAHQPDRGEPGSCLLGSVKGNLGHTVAAAGALGLIKCALSLQRERIPGTLHYRQPNPQIDFSATPFRVSSESQDWLRSETPRYAAVSSFGVGGTNAHLILGEAPAAAQLTADHSDAAVLLPLSARTPEAALARARQLADWLEASPRVSLAAVQSTLVGGRVPMPQRLAVAATDRAEAIAALRAVSRCDAELDQPRLVFLLPGQGSQSAGMAAPLHAALPAFAEALEAALAAVGPHLDIDLGELLLRRDDAEANTVLQQTRYAQPALFCHGYALARWLDTLGLRPAALIGHSLGELVGACLAGVLDLPAAAQLVCARGAAMWAQPRGAMLAVRQSAAQLAARLPQGIEIAGYNAPELTVLSGPAEAIDRFAGDLGEAEVRHTRLHVSHAFHSAAMDGALPAVRAAFTEHAASAPVLPLYSCVSGQPLSGQEATDPDYWARQVRAPVRFAEAVARELAQPDTVFVEVGPGQALSALVRMQRGADGSLPRVIALQAPAGQPASALDALSAVGRLWALGCGIHWPLPRGAARTHLPGYPFADTRFWFPRSASVAATDTAPTFPIQHAPAPAAAQETAVADRRPVIEAELTRLLAEVCGLPESDIARDVPLLELGLDSLSLTQASLELDRVFGIKLRFRRLMEDLDTVAKLGAHFDAELPAERFQPAPAVAATAAPAAAAPIQATAFSAPPGAVPAAQGNALNQLIQQQMALMQQQLALLAGQPIPAPPAAAPAPMAAPAAALTAAAPTAARTAPTAAEADAPIDLREKPFGASARIKLSHDEGISAAQQAWIEDFTLRYLARLGRSRAFAQQHRALMADPRVVTGFNPQWKDLVFPVVADRSDGARIWDIDGNEYIDLLSCFGANLLGYQPKAVVAAMHAQLDRGIEVGPSHPLAATVSQLISEFTGHPRVAFCNTGSEAVMGVMRVARTVTGRKTIAIFTNSYHGIFDEVIVRGTRQLRSLSAAPGILASAVENVLVLDYADEASLKILRERGHELAAIMIEPIQNKYPTLQPREFVRALREICDAHGCALIFDEVVTGFRLAPGGAQQFYGVRADLCTYGKIIGGGLPLAAIGGSAHWLDALDGGFWQYGDGSYPEAGVTYFAGTFVRHPLALAAAQATLEHLKAGGQAYYDRLNARTQGLADRLNAGFAARSAPCKAVHCASLWRLHWDEDQRHISLFYYLARFRGLHLFEQFGHFVTEAMGEAEIDRIVEVFFACLDELMALGLITRRDGLPPPEGGQRHAAVAVEAPLSPGQEERWLAAGFDAHALRALNETFVLRLDGALDLDALQRALRALRQRHAALDLRLDPESPKQRLGTAGAIEPLPLQDLSTEADPEAALQAFAERAGQRQFALGEPMIALSLLRLGPQSHALHVVASHLVFDGWAASVFLAELAALYRAELDGAPARLPLPGSPLAFAVEEQARMEGSEGRESLAFWTAALRDPPAPPELGDRRPDGPRRFSADTLRCDFDRDLLEALRKQARAHRSTLFQLLLAVVAQRLRAEGCGDDLVLSLPYASQQLGRHPALLADGVLDLPLRLRLSGDQDALRVLPAVRGALVDALEHPLMTQGRLARALGLPSRGERPPLTGIYFNLNPRLKLDGFAPLAASMREGRKPGLLGELMFNFYEGDEGLALDLHHSTEFFSPQRIAELAASLRADLQRAAGLQPTAVDLPEVIRAANATGKPLPAAPRIEHWLAERAAQCAEAIAVVDADRQWTYAELFARAHRIAHCLRQRGVKPGDFVGLCLPRSGELLAALLGVLEAGAAYVPLDPYFPLQRLRDMVEDAGLSLLLADRENAARLGAGGLATLLLDADAAALDAAPSTPLGLAFEADAPAYVIYTSGSTGKPKGVVVLQRGVCNFLRSMAEAPGLSARDTLLAVTTLSFDIAVLELLLPLYVGGRVVIARREDAVDGAALRGLIERHAVSVVQATPGTWHLLLESGFRPASGFRALCGGEALSPALAERLLGAGVAELWNMYGPTETTIWSTVARVTDPDAINVGRPIDNTVVRILDDQGRQLGVGEAGELCIGGAGVARGYHARPELTAERFIADAWGAAGERLYRTGDLAAWNADGTLRHMGRLDHQVKLRGYRIELGEIEAALERLPEIARAAVLVQNFGPLDDRLVACVAAQPGAEVPSLTALRRALNERLPDYMLPQAVRTLPALPQLPNGKIDRKALAAAPIEAPPASPAPTPSVPSSPAADIDDLATRIAAEMARLLQRDAVGPQQNFFELGGHSLLAAQLAGAVQRLSGQRPSLRQIFEAPSAAGLARALQVGAPADETTLPPLEARAERDRAPLSLMQRRLWFVEQTTPDPGVNLLPSAHRLLGPMDVETLRRAVHAFVVRHAALRTVFAPSADGAEQRILADIAFDCPLVDLSALPREAAEARIIDAVRAAQHQAFDLRRGPPFRCALFRLGTEEHVFLWVVHHLVWDGWCFDLLYRDLGALYAAELSGKPADLPVIERDYGDFCTWQRALLDSGRLQPEVEAWKQRLADLPAPLSLPLDHPRAANWSGRGGSLRVRLDAPTVARLHALARAQGGTLFMLLLATYARLLQQLSGQRDLLVGTPLRGREFPELLPVVGFFVNALPLRLRGEASAFSDWLGTVKAAIGDALAQPNIPLEQLVQALRLLRDSSRPALFQTLFSYQDVRERPPGWGPLHHQRVDVPIRGSAYELGLWCVETRGGLEMVFTYASDLFEAATVTGWARRLEGLLGQLARDGLSISMPVQAPAPAGASPASAASSEAPAASRSQAVDALASIWKRLLDVQRIAPEDNFFELGGHSMLAMRLSHELAQATGIEVNVGELMARPSFAALSALVASLAGSVSHDGADGDEARKASAVTEAPLTPFQSRLLFVELSTPGRNANVIPSTRRLRGPLDPRALARAVKALGQRQPMLRVAIVPGAEGMRQRLDPEAELALEQVDLSGLPVEQREAEALRRVEAMQDEPFDLGHAPLVRIRLLRLDSEDHLLATLSHHLISDGRSSTLLFAELAELYAAQVEGRAPRLPPLSGGFLDHARRIAEHGSADDAAELAPWLARFSALPPAPRLPWDRPRPSALSGQTSSVRQVLPQALSSALRSRAGEAGTTLFVLLLQVFHGLLQRLSGQADLTFGVPVLGRNDSAQENLIGPFANVLPVRIRGTGDQPVTLQQVHQQFFDAMALPTVELDALNRALHGSRPAADARLIHALISFQDVRSTGQPRWSGLAVEPFPTRMRRNDSELALWCSEQSDGLQLLLSYSTDLLDDATAADWLQQLVHALSAQAAPSPAPSSAATALAPPATAAQPSTDGASEMQALLSRIWCELLQVPEVSAEDNFFELGGHSLLALTMLARVEVACGRRLSLLRVGDSSLRALAHELAGGDQPGARAETVAAAAQEAPPATTPRRGWLGRLLGG